MTRNVIFTLTILMIQQSVFAQQFANDIPALLNQFPFFNSTMMKGKKVKQISTQVMYKSPNKKIIFSSESATFTFDFNGNVEKWSRTNKSGISSSTTYYFSKTGALATEHITSTNSSVLKSYQYNEQGLITEIQLADAKTAKTIQEDKFKYEFFTDYQYKKYWLNNEGLTYKYTLVDLDNKGRKKEERTRYIRGTSRETIYYTYTNNWLTLYSDNVKEHSRRETKYLLEYDQNGDLLIMNEYKDGALITHYEYLYEDGLLIAILQKNINSQRIKITKVKYLFYP